MNIPRSVPSRSAFTLVEVLVSMAILSLLMLMLVSMTDATQRTWSYTTGRIEQFRAAREAFESVTRRLSQATLNTYWDYDNVLSPTKYQRQSELRFISGDSNTLTSSTVSPTHAIFFQAPVGFVATPDSYRNRENLLNTWGYYIEFGSNKLSRPDFINKMANPPPERHRFRLMELMEPSESLSLYKHTNGKTVYGGSDAYIGTKWFMDPLAASPRLVRTVAENIVALVILPKLSPADADAGNYPDGALSPTYLYDSTGRNMTTVSDSNLNPTNQLPPVIQITMVAVDETSFARYQSGPAMPDLGLAALFQTVGDTSDSTKPGYARDLETLQATLQSEKLSYRVFTTNIALKAAKWSRAQTN